LLRLPAGKKRKLDAAGSDAAVETDEQLARRLHEELNALTRHARRAPAPAPALSTQRSKGLKPAAAGASKPAAPKAKQQLPGSSVEQAEDAQDEGAAANKSRKRTMLNRELAMLVVDMVETHVKPVTGPRSKSKDEQDQQDQQQQDDNHSAAAKHESSSSLSEQERLAIEHLHAAGVEAKPVNKLLDAPHLTARVSEVHCSAAGTSQRMHPVLLPCLTTACICHSKHGCNSIGLQYMCVSCQQSCLCCCSSQKHPLDSTALLVVLWQSARRANVLLCAAFVSQQDAQGAKQESAQ
jgi:hypothetical protein